MDYERVLKEHDKSWGYKTNKYPHDFFGIMKTEDSVEYAVLAEIKNDSWSLISVQRLATKEDQSFSYKSYDEINFFMQRRPVSKYEYEAFMNFVNDSIVRFTLADCDPEKYINYLGEDMQIINWQAPIKVDDDCSRENLNQLGCKLEYKRYRMPLDSLKYEYYWIDFRDPKTMLKEVKEQKKDGFIIREVIDVVPDSTFWIDESCCSCNPTRFNAEFFYKSGDYDEVVPMYGLSNEQAKAYAAWVTYEVNKRRQDKGKLIVRDYQLPNALQRAVIQYLIQEAPEIANIDSSKIKYPFPEKLNNPSPSYRLVQKVKIGNRLKSGSADSHIWR